MKRAAEGEGNCQTRVPNFYVANPGFPEVEDAKKRLAGLNRWASWQPRSGQNIFKNVRFREERGLSAFGGILTMRNDATAEKSDL